LNKRNLSPGEESLDADLVFAASGCAFAAQQGLDRELRLVEASRLRMTGPREIIARDGNPGASMWWRSLRDRNDWMGSRSQRMWMAAKYLMRAATVPAQHQRFMAFLDTHPLMSAHLRRDPRLLERHLHRFVNRHWHRTERLRSLHYHYRHLLERWPSRLFEAVYVRGRSALGAVALKDGSVLQVHLCPPIHKGCEGELSIELSDANGRVLYRLVLTVIDDQPTVAIGCIQGPEGDDARELVRELTRNLHGMRPKQLMLTLTYAFAAQCGARRVLAVGNAAHPLNKRRNFHADYDAFWLEQGGVEVRDGWFQLPTTLPHRSEAEVPSRHRAAFRRRDALRQQVDEMLFHALRDATWRRSVAVKSVPSSPGAQWEASWIS